MTEPTIPTAGESDIRREIQLYKKLGPKRGVASLVEAHRRSGLPVDVASLQNVIASLLAESEGWRAALRAREKGRQNCPGWLRTLIGTIRNQVPVAHPPGTRVSSRTVLRQSRTAASKGSLTIEQDVELGVFKEHQVLVEKLSRLLDQQRPIDLEVAIKSPFVYVHGLALLAAWCERHAARVHLNASSPQVDRYLTSTGYRRVVEEMLVLDELQWDSENHVALTTVDPTGPERADEIARRLVRLFDDHFQLGKPAGDALTVMFAELVENVYRHSESTQPAFVMAQAYPKTRKLHVGVADTGIGIYDSFRRSDIGRVRQRARTELLAIDMAVERLVTSKSAKHSGYGLFVVRRLVEHNRGTMRVMSGGTTRLYWFDERRGTPQKEALPHKPWQGTEVSLMFDLNNPLPINKVYAELGSIEDDFFAPEA